MPLPKPRPREERGDFISRCISFAVRDGMPQDQAIAACHTAWRANKQNTMKNINLSYSVPIKIVESTITEEGSENDEFMIEGIAINATLTDNNHKFLAEELKPAAKTLVNRPLLKDHDDSVDSIVGRVIEAKFDELGQNIRFQARINNTEVGQKIKELIIAGDLNTVSVGASVKELEDAEDFIIPRGIKFKELSLVATPADDDAQFTFNGNSFEHAITMAWNKTRMDDHFPCPHCPLFFETEDKLHKHIEKLHAKETKDKKDGKNSNSQTGDLITSDNQLNTKTRKQMVETKTKNETTEKEVQEESQEEESEESVSKEVLKIIEDSKSENEKRFDSLESTQKATTEILSDVMKGLNSLQSSLDKLKVKEADVDEEEAKEEPEEAQEEQSEEVESEEESKSEEEPEAESQEEAEEESEDEDESEDVDEQSEFKIQAGHGFFTVIKNKYR